MKLALMVFAVLTSLSLSFSQQWPAQRECRGKVLPITTLPGPQMTGPRLPLRFGGTRQWPGPPLNSFISDTGFRLVIRSEEEFRDFWKRYTGSLTTDSKPTMPEIDFTKEMIIVSALGVRPTSGGYWTFIDGACEVDGRVEVLISNVDNPQCGGALTSLSYPADAVRIPRSDLPVVFRETPVSCADWKKFIRYH